MTDADLADLCALWQKRLRLQDWDVAVRFAPWHELKGGTRGGQVQWIREKRAAFIDVARPGETEPNSVWPYDLEITLVHELLHLHTQGLGTRAGSPEEEAEEQAVHALSCALVSLARQIPVGDAKTQKKVTP